jgi:hypothetical protein
LSDERLDTTAEIAKFLGVSRSYFNEKVKHRLESSGILFTRPGYYGKSVFYTYKRLLMAWLIEVKDI